MVERHEADDDLDLAVDGGVATIRIDRPLKKNALTRAMWVKLADMVESLSIDPATRVLVLEGAGEDFCAGADIGEFDSVRGDASSARAYEAVNVRAFAAISRAPMPTIASIRGICFGGGFGLAASCDIRIASPDARFRLPPARLGLAYPAEAMASIVHALGPQMASYLVSTASVVDADWARQAGFLLEIVDEGDVHRRAMVMAGEIAQNAPLSIRAAKAAIAAVLDPDPDLARRAAELGDATFESADYAEGRAAFRQRRTPVFTGR
ncbi:MAG: enoyl-CoA hydratase/isomerase family protein [Rhizobiaceae bacterium]|nr:enoyl-CoA hydratase/isomerase family protein [Rhizobiaceae bacterium]MCV0408636.1 enoyl-CoA hydratase/isomerase family protein [Rhizobiaceae bacterium]